MANGKVITGYSKPYVALYTYENDTITYSNGMPLARGVNVNVSAENGEGTNFYADNVVAESVGGIFTGATATMVVDGLKEPARKLIMGLPDAEEITVGGETYNVVKYDNRQKIPYVGIGFCVRYMENGNTTYTAVVFKKAAFSVDGLEANTQEESIEFQTTELEATLMRDDSQYQEWKNLVEELPTEADAEAAIKALLGISEESGNDDSNNDENQDTGA